MLAAWELPGGVQVRASGRAEGDLRSGRRQREIVGLPWTTLRQVHGSKVVVVAAPGQGLGREADAAVSKVAGAALAVLSADCAPVALGSPEGVFGVAHAGWRGLLQGVVEAAVEEMRRLGAGDVQAVIGPCIHPCCYAFGTAELEGLAARYGPSVRSRSSGGELALDLPAAVRAALSASGAELLAEHGACTGCSGEHWSWRARRDEARQAMVAWRW